MIKDERIKALLDRYNSMSADAADIRKVEQLLENGTLQLEDLKALDVLQENLQAMQAPEPTASLDERFYAMLKKEEIGSGTIDWKSFFSWKVMAPRLAFASVLLVAGFIAGRLMAPAADDSKQIDQLGQEVSSLKEVMMLSLLEKESATDRLKAVSLTEDMDQASKKVTTALIQTLNNDENVNVRLAALDALRPYSREGSVREALIRSIGHQQSPLVQIALAELMAELQAKGSVKELEKILRSNNTPEEVKKKIQESIQVIS